MALPGRGAASSRMNAALPRKARKSAPGSQLIVVFLRSAMACVAASSPAVPPAFASSRSIWARAEQIQNCHSGGHDPALKDWDGAAVTPPAAAVEAAELGTNGTGVPSSVGEGADAAADGEADDADVATPGPVH